MGFDMGAFIAGRHPHHVYLAAHRQRAVGGIPIAVRRRHHLTKHTQPASQRYTAASDCYQSGLRMPI